MIFGTPFLLCDWNMIAIWKKQDIHLLYLPIVSSRYWWKLFLNEFEFDIFKWEHWPVNDDVRGVHNVYKTSQCTVFSFEHPDTGDIYFILFSKKWIYKHSCSKLFTGKFYDRSRPAVSKLFTTDLIKIYGENQNWSDTVFEEL